MAGEGSMSRKVSCIGVCIRFLLLRVRQSKSRANEHRAGRERLRDLVVKVRTRMMLRMAGAPDLRSTRRALRLEAVGAGGLDVRRSCDVALLSNDQDGAARLP